MKAKSIASSSNRYSFKVTGTLADFSSRKKVVNMGGLDSGGANALCHVWTGPGLQEFRSPTRRWCSQHV